MFDVKCLMDVEVSLLGGEDSEYSKGTAMVDGRCLLGLLALLGLCSSDTVVIVATLHTVPPRG